MPTRLSSQTRKPFRKRSLLSSAIAIHVAALAVAMATNNPVESIGRTSGLSVIGAEPVTTEGPVQKDTIFETSYSGADYDDWVDDLTPMSETSELRDELRDELRSEVSESPLDFPPIESGIDTDFLDSEFSSTTAN